VSEQFAVNMLGGFEVSRDSQLLDLPPSCRRLVALAALKRRAIPRAWVCQTLWPTTRLDRATARLRTTLWRLRPMGADGLLTVTQQSIAIARDVNVDWYDAVDLIGQLLGHCVPVDPGRDLSQELLPLLGSGQLLDGWTDEWNACARSTYRDLRLDALDELVGAWVGYG
jgi:DNA-binding SARP family transcriptional activator